MNNFSILKKEMTRKEFIIFVITLVVAISGIPRILTILKDSTSPVSSNPKQGFGSRPYGA